MKTITLTDEQYAVLRALLEWTCGEASEDADDDGYVDDEDDRGHIEAAQTILGEAAQEALGYGDDPGALDDPKIDEEVDALVFSLYDLIVEAAEAKAQEAVAPPFDGCLDL